MTETERFSVEIIYALPTQQKRIRVMVTAKTTCLEAVEQSGIKDFFPEIDLATVKLGIFGRVVKPDVCLQSGQRVEIYRPLIADPKDIRRRRARKSKDEVSNSITD